MHGADIADDVVGNQILGADNTAQIQGVDDTLVGDVTQFGDDLRHAHGSGIQRNDHIQFLFASQGYNCIKAGKTFTFQKVGVACVAMDDGGVWQKFRKLLAARVILFHNGHGNAALFQCGCQVDTGTTAAAKQAVSHTAGNDTQIFQQCGQILSRGGNENTVAFFEGECTTVGNQSLTVTQNGTDQNAALNNAVQIHQLNTQKFALAVDTQFYDFGSAFGEYVTAKKTGEFQKTFNFVGCLPFRIDGHGKTKGVTHFVDLVVIFRIADAGDGVQLGVQTVGSGAA